MITLLEGRPTFDAHLAPQTWFLPKNASNVRLFRVEDGEKPVQDFLCGMLGCLKATNASDAVKDNAPRNCPRISVGHLRSRREPDYRRAQYDISLDQLPLQTVQRITALFREDYCRFGYPTKPGVDPVICGADTLNTNSAATLESKKADTGVIGNVAIPNPAKPSQFGAPVA